ncbi:class F sortase [Streptomyces sp. NPDC047097]|uniref:class F sortase n=1 Tax=Streptomyces sp. NPDC047097 TaxID=3155260 RepID=UPI00340DA3D2
MRGARRSCPSTRSGPVVPLAASAPDSLTRRGHRIHLHGTGGPGTAWSTGLPWPTSGPAARALRRERRLLRLGTASFALATAALLCPLPVAVPAPPDAGSLPVRAMAAPGPAAAVHSPPVALTVPGHLTAVPVDAVTADRQGAMAVPDSPRRLGWWALGALPGAPHGTVLLAGHLDSAAEGAGPFQRLHSVPVGARAQVTTADGTRHHYRVIARRSHPAAALPRDLFGSTGTPRLVLVTCTGAFDPVAHTYADNLLLYAEPVPGP